MNPILATELVTRFILWAFILSAEIFMIAMVQRAAVGISFYETGFAVASLILVLSLFFTNNELVWDIREILFYEVLLLFSAYLLYHFKLLTLTGFAIPAYTLLFLKFIRLLLPAKLIDERNTNGDAYAAWPVFGPIGLWRKFSKTRFKRIARPEFHRTQAYVSIVAAFVISWVLFVLDIAFNLYYIAILLVLGIAIYHRKIHKYIYLQNDLHFETAKSLNLAGQQREAMLDQLASKNAELQSANVQREEMLVDLAKRNEILRDASHDLAQPLMGISYFARQLTQAHTAHEQEDYAQKLLSAVDGLGHLIDDTIHNAKITTKLESPTLELVSVEYLADRLWAQFLNAAHDKGIGFNLYKGTLSVLIDPNRPERGSRSALDFAIMTDEDVFWRIISNLIVNAINNTSEGRILVAFRARGDQCWVEVHDTGSGIPNADGPDRKANFITFAESIKTRYGTFKKGTGHGLGVNNVRQLCNAIGTHMELHSRVGRGSIFSFKVPLALANFPASQN
jgi:signal transduction histidine kinase